MAFSLLFFGTHPRREGGGSGRGRRGKRAEERDVLRPRVGRRERDAATAKKGERAGTERGRERERFGAQFAPSSWPGTTKEALSRGCSFGQCLLFLPRSLPSPSLSLARVYPCPFHHLLALFLSLPLAPRSLSSLPPTSSTPVLHRAHETRVPAKSLCHLANERPSAARIIPRCARSRKISSSRRRCRRRRRCRCRYRYHRRPRRWRRRGDPAPRITGNIVRPENERERGAFGNVHTYRGLKARTVDKEEAFSFGLFPPAAARNSVKVPRPLAAGSAALSIARRR